MQLKGFDSKTLSAGLLLANSTSITPTNVDNTNIFN